MFTQERLRMQSINKRITSVIAKHTFGHRRNKTANRKVKRDGRKSSECTCKSHKDTNRTVRFRIWKSAGIQL